MSFVGGLGERVERGVAQAHRERGLRRGQPGREGGVVDDRQALHGRGRRLGAICCRVDLGVPVDGLEEVGVELGVGDERAEVPGIHERLGVYGLAVGELPARLELDGEGLGVCGGDRFGDLVDRLALGVIADEALEQQLHDEATADLVGVGRQEGVLRLGAGRQDDAPAVGLGGDRATATCRQEQGKARRSSDDCHAASTKCVATHRSSFGFQSLWSQHRHPGFPQPLAGLFHHPLA
jgi:hypothetical protein